MQPMQTFYLYREYDKYDIIARDKTFVSDLSETKNDTWSGQEGDIYTLGDLILTKTKELPYRDQKYHICRYYGFFQSRETFEKTHSEISRLNIFNRLLINTIQISQDDLK